MGHECIKSTKRHYGMGRNIFNQLIQRGLGLYTASRFIKMRAQFWGTLVLQSLPCREAYIMYVPCIMYKTAWVASVLLRESLQTVFPAKWFSVRWDCYTLLQSVDCWQRSHLPGVLCYISIYQDRDWALTKSKPCRINRLKALKTVCCWLHWTIKSATWLTMSHMGSSPTERGR